jgi:hypothetical protein
MNYVKNLLQLKLDYHEKALRDATLNEDDKRCRHHTSVVLELKRTIEILVASGEY